MLSVLNRIKQLNRLSIRWKWTWLLSFAFITFYLLISFTMILVLRHNQFESEKVISQKSSQQIIAFVEKDNSVRSPLDYEQLFNPDKANREYDYLSSTLQRDGVLGRIVDASGKVVFESAGLRGDVIENAFFNHPQVVMYHGKEAIIITHSLQIGQQSQPGYVQLVYTLKNYHARINEMYQNYITISLIASVICVVLAYGISLYLFLPIKHMAQTMASLKEDAETKKRMDLSKRRSDELMELSVGFNELLDTMDLYINQQKQFVEDVSHELRTPVAIVEGHLKLLNRWGKNDPQVLEESLHASLNEIERMKTLVQEMLDLSRAEQVGINYKNEVTEVLSLIYQIHQNFVIINEDFTFTLEIDGDKNKEIFVPIARHHLEQVFIILLDNAVKYSTDKPYIHISLSSTVNHVQISIQDYGEGIREEDIAKVFGRFYRVDKARSRHKGGNGLGLSIAKELIEGYKGTIHVESVINSGSIFRIELPIITDSTKIAQAKQKTQQHKEGKHVIN
ncbi:HAMP domain-containing histidine kinase [Carnobacteriaceae bacterium zg-C25]|nr:HAMP domain-containing histidine kinase [Carnobacteriaceae bacterium zg-ZUI240]QTU83347.1 HAMP domain-containing histidine kinase [Carnobacteriaceae bacterium zg-C25]